jgi:hypothetical protein
MKLIHTIALGVILTLPAVFGPKVAHAQNQNDLLGRVQGLLNGNNSNAEQRAYEEGRRDEWRHQHAERQRERWRSERPGYDQYGSNYNNGYRDNGNGYSYNGPDYNYRRP